MWFIIPDKIPDNSFLNIAMQFLTGDQKMQKKIYIYKVLLLLCDILNDLEVLDKINETVVKLKTW